jgi:hypothetical protein
VLGVGNPNFNVKVVSPLSVSFNCKSPLLARAISRDKLNPNPVPSMWRLCDKSPR